MIGDIAALYTGNDAFYLGSARWGALLMALQQVTISADNPCDNQKNMDLLNGHAEETSRAGSRVDCLAEPEHHGGRDPAGGANATTS